MELTGMYKKSLVAAAALLAVTAMSAQKASALDVILKAGEFTHNICLNKQCTQSVPVVMWGFGMVADAADVATYSVPGPTIQVPPGDTTLNITLINELPADTNESLSIVIPGLPMPTTTAGTGPVKIAYGAENTMRARSFVAEAAPGASETYSWTNIRPGTFLYQSGSHQAVTVQMGLYGAMLHDTAVISPTEAVSYDGINYNSSVLVILSEVDPALHEAVATRNYGPTGTMTSTIDYDPKYFLVNGQPYPAGGVALLGPRLVPVPGETLLFRFLNAGLRSFVPTSANGQHAEVIAEDGFAYKYSKIQNSVLLAPGKTIDGIVKVPPRPAGKAPRVTGFGHYLLMYDRALNLTNHMEGPGGLIIDGPFPPPGGNNPGFCFIDCLDENE